MKLQSFCPTVVLPEPAQDYRTAARVEQYRMGETALYTLAFPGARYLPYAAVRRAWVQPSSMALTGCCGKELPITVLRVRCQDGTYQTYTFEKAESAQRVLEKLQSHIPNLVTTPESREERENGCVDLAK